MHLDEKLQCSHSAMSECCLDMNGPHLQEVLIHACAPIHIMWVELWHLHLIQWVLHPGIVLPKAEMINRVAGVKLGRTKWHQVMHVHVALLE